MAMRVHQHLKLASQSVRGMGPMSGDDSVLFTVTILFMYKRSRYKYNIMTTTSWAITTSSWLLRGSGPARTLPSSTVCVVCRCCCCRRIVVARARDCAHVVVMAGWPCARVVVVGRGAVRVVVNARSSSSGPAGAQGACDCHLVGVLCVRGRRRAGALVSMWSSSCGGAVPVLVWSLLRRDTVPRGRQSRGGAAVA